MGVAPVFSSIAVFSLALGAESGRIRWLCFALGSIGVVLAATALFKWWQLR
jgi:hypothetical protein